MGIIPGSIPTHKVISALERDGWRIVRHHRSSHIRLGKLMDDGFRLISISDHHSVPKQNLARLLKQARIDIDRFLELL